MSYPNASGSFVTPSSREVCQTGAVVNLYGLKVGLPAGIVHQRWSFRASDRATGTPNWSRNDAVDEVIMRRSLTLNVLIATLGIAPACDNTSSPSAPLHPPPVAPAPQPPPAPQRTATLA